MVDIHYSNIGLQCTKYVCVEARMLQMFGEPAEIAISINKKNYVCFAP